jgi:hypothetical protein
MSNQDSTRDVARNRKGAEGPSDWSSNNKDRSSASAVAQDAAGKVKQAAVDTAGTVTGEVKELLNRQLGGGAETLGFVARSARRAAEDLERDSPQVAGLVRSLASQVDGYADGLRDRSVEEIWQSAADYTRRQPALVFGLAAVAGFFALRIVKTTAAIAAPSIQPLETYSQREDRYHGV